MKSKIPTMLMIFFMVFAIGCSNDDENISLAPGKYSREIIEFQDPPWVMIYENGTFEFNRGSVTSYRPTGTYIVKDHLLILNVSETEYYEFMIKDETIIFDRGQFAEELVEKGTVFRRGEEDN